MTYVEALSKVVRDERILDIMRKRRLYFGGFVARMGHNELPKIALLEELFERGHEVLGVTRLCLA